MCCATIGIVVRLLSSSYYGAIAATSMVVRVLWSLTHSAIEDVCIA